MNTMLRITSPEGCVHELDVTGAEIKSSLSKATPDQLASVPHPVEWGALLRDGEVIDFTGHKLLVQYENGKRVLVVE